MIANDVKTFDSNAPIVAAVGSGEIDVGLVNHYYLYRFLAEEGANFPARNHFEKGSGPGALVLVSAAGIVESAANREAAEEFIAYLLSQDVQSRFVRESSEYAVVEGIDPPAGLPPLDDLARGSMAPEDLADLEGTLDMLRDVGALP
jgi:iron(III) transport system substrate-binding protein